MGKNIQQKVIKVKWGEINKKRKVKQETHEDTEQSIPQRQWYLHIIDRLNNIGV